MIEAKKLAGLEPASVFAYFEKICSIPHGSCNTKLISDYLVCFAKEHDLRYEQDDLNNVIIFQDGTCGLENADPVILQGHMDMVCQKDEDCDIDMQNQGLDVMHDGNCVFAKGRLWAVMMVLPWPMHWLFWPIVPLRIRHWKWYSQ